MKDFTNYKKYVIYYNKYKDVIYVNINKIDTYLKENLSKKRYEHSLLVAKEAKSLAKIYHVDEEKAYLEGLIKRAAFMRCNLEDMEKDLNEKGFTEMFTQSAQAPPYERERPMARMYNSLNKNYQTLMKQLSDFVDRTEKAPEDDGFDEFLRNGK